MIGCNCNAGLSNTGRPGCVPVFGITSSMILVPLKANDGTLNGIDLNATLPVWSDLINEADASKRWFPLPAFENVELAKADSQFEESNSGRKAFLRQGTRSFAGELWAEDSTPTLLGKLYNVRCVDFGIYIVDVNGNLIGSEVDGYLYPIPVDNASWDPKFMFATDSAVQKIMLAFDIDRLFNEATMYNITVTEANQDFTKLEGLIDVNFLALNVTSTDVTFDAKLDYGTALNKILFKGALLTDFALYNNTTSSSVTLSGIQENVDGNYTLTFTAQTAGDSMILSINKDGYDGEVTFVAL